MIAHVNEPCIIKRYPMVAGLYIDGGEWMQNKYKLGLDIPTMPYLIDGDTHLTQTMAICVYLEQKHGLCPAGPGANAKTLGESVMMLNVACDWKDSFRLRVVMPKPKEEAEAGAKQYREGVLPKNLKQLDAMLGKKKTKFMHSDTPLSTDFFMFDYLDMMMRFAQDVVKQYPNVVSYYETVSETDAVKKVKKEEPGAFWPAYPQFCMWGHD